MTARSIALFIAAALAEIGGAYLVWVGLRDDKGPLVVALGVIALGLYGVVAALQPENEFGRVLAAYGGVFIVGSIAWGIAFDSFRPDRYDLAGAAICLSWSRRDHVRTALAPDPPNASSEAQRTTSSTGVWIDRGTPPVHVRRAPASRNRCYEHLHAGSTAAAASVLLKAIRDEL